MIKFNKILERKGFPISRASQHLKELRELPLDKFQSNVETRKWEIFNHHFDGNEVYQNHVGKRVENWEDIPVLTKSDLQMSLDKRLTSGFTQKSVYLNNTSGSSGHPFYFAKDKYCHALTWAVIFDRFSRHGLVYGKSKQARFYGIPLEFPKYQKEKLKDYFMNRMRFPIFDLSDATLEKYVAKFRRIKFEYINGYTSSIVLLAKYCKREGIRLVDECPTLKVCLVTSEMCTDMDRKTLEEGLGVPVVNEYGASELDLIAFEDEDGDWTTTTETLLIEVLDEQGNVLPEGKEGRIVITSLFNMAMPFIRYEIGDIGALTGKLKGVNGVLGALQGRTNDVAELPSGKKVPGLTFYYVSKALLESGDAMKEFIIAQDQPNHFRFEYVSDRELTKEQISEVRSLMDKYLEPALEATFIRKETLDRSKAGKLKHFSKEF